MNNLQSYVDYFTFVTHAFYVDYVSCVFEVEFVFLNGLTFVIVQFFIIPAVLRGLYEWRNKYEIL